MKSLFIYSKQFGYLCRIPNQIKILIKINVMKSFNLEKSGITNPKIYRNLSVPRLYEMALQNENGVLKKDKKFWKNYLKVNSSVLVWMIETIYATKIVIFLMQSMRVKEHLRPHWFLQSLVVQNLCSMIICNLCIEMNYY